MEDTIHLAIISSNDYAPYMATTLMSVLDRLDKKRNCHIYVLTQDLTRSAQKKLKKLRRIHDFEIDYIHINESDLDFIKGVNVPYYINRLAASRLLLPSILHKLDKVICIESDLIFLDDIAKLYDTDIGDNYIGAVEDFARKVHAKDLWDNEKDIYFNTGVILINLKKLREINYKDKLIHGISRNASRYKLQEQCIMNDVYKGHIQRLDIKWNFYHEFYPIELKRRIKFQAENKKEYLNAVTAPSVIHTPGADKMWHPHYQHPFKEEYMRLYKKNPFYSMIKLWNYKIHNHSRYVYLTVFDIPILSIIRCKEGKRVSLFGVTIYQRKGDNIAGGSKTDHIAPPTHDHQKGNSEILECKAILNELKSQLTQMMETQYQMMWLPDKVAALHQKVFPQFKNIHDGEDVVIVGCGPTLLNYTPLPNAKHISLNRAFRHPDIKFDYAFIWDLRGMIESKDGTVEDFLNYDCTKFLGKFMADNFPFSINPSNKKGKLYRCYSSARHLLPSLNPVDNVIHDDLSSSPLADFMSVSFGALQFAIWTHPKRIFLVGCDTVMNGSFDGRQNSYMFDDMFRGYRLFKKFITTRHPEIEIISVNPIGLRGIFHDVYTSSYLALHPEIKKVKILDSDNQF